VVPDGSLDLLWRNGNLEVAGPDTGHRRVPLEPGELICGVRLRPGAARPLLGEVPATAVRDAQPDLDVLWGEEARQLEDRAAAAADPWQAAGRLAEALTARLRVHRPDPVAVAVAKALDRPRPTGIAGLAWELGYSERQLRRRVLAAAGYGPKTLEQILRFRRSLAAAGTGADWSRIAAEQGYADQAHLSRQLRRWSGATPRELAAQPV
jgi:AraC-like DNA-binding protein